jgi:predicted dienelactone hydrolase
MKRVCLFGILFLASLPVLAATFASDKGVFTDDARERKIPYKVYYPKPLQGQYPVIIVSHGLGGSRDGNEELGEQLAKHGFVAIHIQHEGSDEGLYQGMRDRRMVQMALGRSLRDPINAQNRFLDAPFVVTRLAVLNEHDKHLKGHLNLEALGMAGHSYGAVSTTVAAGERVGLAYQSFKVPTLRAGLVLSPSPPREGADTKRAYQDVTIPLFHMTGSEDESLLDARSVKPADRVKPYEMLSLPNQYLLVLNLADHITFSGRRIGTREELPLDKKHMVAIVNGAVAFFRAYLQDDASAKAWLQGDYKKELASADRFEWK